jgi:hypothetical protein
MLPGPDEIIRCPVCLGLLRHSTLASGNTFGAELWSDGRLDAPMLPDSPPVVLCPCCAAPFWERSAVRVGEIPHERVVTHTHALTLLRAGEHPVRAMKALRDILGCSLQEAKRLVVDTPQVVIQSQDGYRVRSLHRSLERAGAECELTVSSVPEAEPPAEWTTAPWTVEPGEAELYAAARVLANAAEHAEREIRIWAWWKSNDPYRDSAVRWVPFSERPGEARESLRRLLDLLDSSVDAERMMIAEGWRELGEFETCLRVLSGPISARLSATATQLQELARRGEERVCPVVMPEPVLDEDD